MIRKATENDKEAIAALWRKDGAFLGGLYMGALKERIEKHMVHVACNGESLLGFVEYRKRLDGVTVIYHLAVAESERGKGFGQALLNSLSLPMRLKVTADNPQAIRFYERYGLVKTGEEAVSSGRCLYVYERWV